MQTALTIADEIILATPELIRLALIAPSYHEGDLLWLQTNLERAGNVLPSTFPEKMDEEEDLNILREIYGLAKAMVNHAQDMVKVYGSIITSDERSAFWRARVATMPEKVRKYFGVG